MRIDSGSCLIRKLLYGGISREQDHPDLITFPVQSGTLFQGRSVLWARSFVRDQRQFCLGAFAVGVMLLTHPRRLSQREHLWIDCAGDEYNDVGSDVSFNQVPFFNLESDNTLGFSTFFYDSEHDHCGPASGFLLQ